MTSIKLVTDKKILKLTRFDGTSSATVAASIAAHNALATGVHGVGASTVDSVAERNAAITAHGLSANIVGWQSINKQGVRFAGIVPANWPTISNSLATVTAISGVVQEYMLQHGYITAVQFYSYNTSGGVVKFKVFRPNGANFDFVGESENITVPTLVGPMSFQLVTPIACQPGDVFGFYSTAAIGVKGGTVTTGIRYASGDVTTSNAFATLLDNLYLAVTAIGNVPYIASTGDSILEGQTTWQSFYDAGPAGTLIHDPFDRVRLLAIDQYLPYQNHCKGSQTFAWVLSTGIVSALATGAKYIWIHCGVNDVQAGRTWAAVLSDLNAIKVLFDAANTTGSRKLMINEILPWTAGTDGNAVSIRTFNTNLAAWCTANSAMLVVCHDAMGQTRGSTGQLDDLLAAYDADGVHLTQAGINALAALMFAYIT